MEATQEVLRIISNETLGSACEMKIVTPSIYKSIFVKNANSHNADIEGEDRISSEILDRQISIFQNIQNETSKNAQKLSDTTDKAISAIKEKNESSLQEILRETQELRREIEKLKESVYKDELTLSYNRKWLNDNYLDGESNSFIKNGTLAIIDLNYFKIINDTYGHIVGDKVLVFVANQLKRTKESVIRYGGDEFMIIFPQNVTADSALNKLNKIREEILQKKLKVGDSSSFKVSFSFGAHEFETGDSLSDVIESADKNMYEDKIRIKKAVTGI